MEQAWTLQVLNDFLDNHRQKGDPAADGVFQYLKDHSQEFYQFQKLTGNSDLLRLTFKKPMSQLLDEVLSTHATFDQTLLKNGHLVFEKYAVPIMAILALYSLPYCYAGEKGAKVLVQSKYLVENPRKRLEETGEFLFAVGSRNAFDESGFGFLHCLKVRLLHARARCYSEAEEEVPINQEDLLGTNLAFSLIVIRGLQKLGIELSPEEKQAYIYLWNCVGRLLGIDSVLLPENLRKASVLERAIRNRQFRPNKEGAILTKALVELYKERWPFGRLRPEEMIGGFLGEEVSKCVELNFSDFLSAAALTSLKLRNSFTHFSVDNFSKIQEKIAEGQYAF